MSKLILFNGPPGIGKSTLAVRYKHEHSGSLLIDIDDIVATFSPKTDEQRRNAGIEARKITIEKARKHLETGLDVVVPQFLGRLPFIEQLKKLADETGNEFIHIILIDSKKNARDRFMNREQNLSLSAAENERRISLLDQQYDLLMKVVEACPSAVVVENKEGQEDVVYENLIRTISDN